MERCLKKERLLLLDDEEDIRELLSEVLSEEGFEVTACEEGDKAYDIFMQAMEEGRPFKILLLDLTVPQGKGGVYFVKRLLQKGINLEGIRVFIMTGFTEKEVKEEAESIPYERVFYKPFSVHKLLEVLRE